jgi:hypothetical protein
MKQITDTVLRPVRFRLNEQTAVNNYYQDLDVAYQNGYDQRHNRIWRFVGNLQEKVLTLSFQTMKNILQIHFSQ